jgi:hypothetical protein
LNHQRHQILQLNIHVGGGGREAVSRTSAGARIARMRRRGGGAGGRRGGRGGPADGRAGGADKIEQMDYHQQQLLYQQPLKVAPLKNHVNVDKSTVELKGKSK